MRRKASRVWFASYYRALIREVLDPRGRDAFTDDLGQRDCRKPDLDHSIGRYLEQKTKQSVYLGGGKA